MTQWEAVIGLEIHVQLNTQSKMFSVAPNRFGDEPNTNITEVCTGQPGSLPVINKEAVRKAVQFGCAVGAEIALFSKFDRKSYFYPDSPRNFQITQFDEPITIGGEIVADVDGEPMTFTIEHAHLEDDAGMLKHFTDFAGVDYNRAGAPLLEIVSDPCMHTPAQAAAYARGIKAIMQYIDASDCNMEEGSLRFDANISVRPHGETGLRTKTEIKNMNSFTFLEMAVEAEIRRQIREYESGGTIEQATYRWDLEKKQTVLMRKKEHAQDYRYFPEPDLPPVILSHDYVEMIRSHLPELPYQRRKRYIKELKLSPYNAGILTTDKALADYFEQALKTCNHPRKVCNWITGEFFGRLKESGQELPNTGILPEHIGQLVAFIEEGTLTGPLAKEIADAMVATPGRSPEELIETDPDRFKPVQDTAALETLVDQVLAEQKQSVDDFLAGKTKAFGFLMGQVMKAAQGKAPPQLVNQLLKDKLAAQA
jgi:aspartyl-tRNA(Asn)/glutamyl-tRNA(Gln) amidotransferase subunit B